VKDQRVIAASMGNHAQAVAYAAGNRKRAVIVMPETASLVKQEATKRIRRRGGAARREHLSDALNYASSGRTHCSSTPLTTMT
jgi:threonine dehydratase